MSLDIEGYEVEALKGIDFRRFRPLVIVVESDSPKHKKGIEGLLLPAGYLEIAMLGDNVFYSLDERLGAGIKDRVFKDIELTHLAHPLDTDGDKAIRITIDTRGGRRSFLKNILKNIKTSE